MQCNVTDSFYMYSIQYCTDQTFRLYGTQLLDFSLLFTNNVYMNYYMSTNILFLDAPCNTAQTEIGAQKHSRQYKIPQ